MGLLDKKTDTAAAGKFEAQEDTAKVDAGATTTAQADTAKVADAPKDTVKAETPGATAVGEVKNTALSTNVSKGSALAGAKDAMVVDYNTLPQIIANNGNFIERESKDILGDTVTFELFSFQDSWVVSPEDDKAPKEVVKYSKDGVNTTDGGTVAEALAHMKNIGYEDARLNQRTVVVGAIKFAAKTEKYNDQLVQFDLSPASRTLWDRYRFNLTYQMKIGRVTEEEGKQIKAEAKLKQKGDKTYTTAEFSVNRA